MNIHELCGWVENPREVERVVSQLMRPVFGLAAPHLKDSGKGQDVFLWQAEESVLGKVTPVHQQTIGDCVSHGFGGAIDTLICVRMAWQNIQSQFQETATEIIYAGSRIEIGKGQLGNQDGSVGAWATEFVLKWGRLPRAHYKEANLDLSTYNGKLAKQLGSSRQGVPDILEPKCKEYPIRTASLLTGGYNEARDAIAGAKCPVVVCSSQAFSLQRDKHGFCAPNNNDRWYHCIYFWGVTDNPKRPGIAYRQSWGPDLPSGPANVTLPHGKPLTLPPGTFFVDAEIFDRMVQKQDCYVISDMADYPARPDEDFTFRFY